MISNTELWKKTLVEGDLVLAYFYANWSDPCRELNRILEKIQKKHGKNTLFLNINVEVYPDLTEEFNINRIPTLLYIKKGKVCEKQIKFHTETVIESTLKKIHESHICFHN